jgi:excisionase family DNA binding protein
VIDTSHSSDIITIPKAAELSGVSRMTMWRWVKSNRLKWTKTPGGHYRIHKGDLMHFLQDRGGQKDSFSTSKWRIMVVDDDKGVQRLLIKMFNNDHFEVLACSNGFEAGRLSISFRPSLIILDLYMPTINGFDVCHMIKNDPSTSHIKILAISGHPNEGNIKRVLKAGADAFLPKPLMKGLVLEQIERLLQIIEEDENINAMVSSRHIAVAGEV